MKNALKKYLIICLTLLPFLATSQSRKVSLFNADEFYSHADYHNALLNYQSALSDTFGIQSMIIPYDINYSKQRLKNKPTQVDSNHVVPIKDYIEHQIGMCLIHTFDYKKAEAHFSEKKTVDSYPEDLYHLAVAQMNMNHHEDAITTFEKYIASENYSDSLLRSAQLSITGCFYALDKTSKHEKVTVALADTAVFNRGTASFAPMYFGSENKLMFTSAREGGVLFDPEKQESAYLCDLYWTEMNADSSWNPARNFGRPLNSGQHDASGTLSSKNIIYYTRWNDEDRSEQSIYLARMVDMKFYEAFKLPASVNVPGYRSINPFVSTDGRTLYFASDRPGGEGGLDIWTIEIDETGNVTGEAKNIGRPINSELDEMSPFFHEVSSVLFFSSNGLNSMGGLDIFKAPYNKQNKGFDNPVNMGSPINSSRDDAYMIWDAMLNIGYFSSDREDCEAGHCYDIYRVVNEPIRIFLEGYAYDNDTGDPLPETKLTFKDIEFVFEPFEIMTDENGFYRTELDNNQEIFIKATKEKYFADAATINTKPITSSTTLIQDFYLNPIPQDEIEIDGIEYDFNSAKLRPSSKVILDELFEFLELNNNLVIEINSHTDARGSDSYNLSLSKRRAKSCVDYLLTLGLDEGRLKAIGFGETTPNFLKDEKKKPVLDENGDRVILTEAYINAQPDEETREKYHQRNRRTAFKVVGESFILKSK
ncbi:MAG: OmpA family protein [Crocinitomicaceae bacterium]|nr:OmpA family protein [Crocinitomicaceae bacterium]